jgi:hypothetical protein
MKDELFEELLESVREGGRILTGDVHSGRDISPVLLRQTPA